MVRKKVVLTRSAEQALEKMGAQIKRARLRRNISVELLAERSGIGKGTLSAIERGVPTVSVGAYAAVLAVLELDKDIQLIALDEEGKKQFWEQNLYPRERASKKK